MPIRVNSAAAALLASGVSVSALILLIYFKFRKSNRRSLPKPPSQDKFESITKLVDQADFDLEAESKEVKEAIFETAESLIPSVKDSQIEAEAAEESVSECENHLDEDNSSQEEELGEEISEEIVEPEVEVQIVRQESASAPGPVTDIAEAVMTTSTDALPSCAGTATSGNNNNQEVVVAEKHEDLHRKESNETGLTVETDIKAADTVIAVKQTTSHEVDRVANWLAKNEQFCRHPHLDQQQHHRLACEDASDDSGRPSSVDTAADVASPRSAGTAIATSSAAASVITASANLQSSAAVAAAMSLSPLNQRHLSGAGDTEDGMQNENCQQMGQFPDRSKVIRGVSPVPGDDNDVIHQFLIPNKLGGSMVGTRGRNINYIRAKSGASVWISRNFFDKKTQVVNVRGPVECVKAALQVIKKRFPELDVKPINTAVPIQRNPALQPTMCQLSLPVGALVDVNVCAMCRGTTVFMQQPTHPSFHHLEKMDYTIMKHYADQASVPALPRPVNPGAVCVAPFGTAWYRAIIADVYPEEDLVLMKYLDWGGYERMPVGCLKQIRTEMMHLPFQAVEGHLAYVSPILTDDEDPETQLERLSRALHERYLSGPGKRIKSQVVYFNDVGQPCVYLYTKEAQSDNWRFLQDDLVQDGLVQWFQMPHPQPQMPQV